MKFNFISKALLMSGMLAMVACSNDEPAIDNGSDNTTGDVAYMKIRIQSADKMSRSTSTPGYEYGTEDEQKVKTVDFFFFDDNGANMDLAAYLVDPNKDDKDFELVEGTTSNVEAVFAENLLVLEKLTGNNYPNYMITIINAHDFKCGTTLRNTLEKLSNWENKNINYFVMSTSSYKGSDATKHNNEFYHATKLNKTDFYLTPDEAKADGKAVNVYVERLAAKVQVSLGESIQGATQVTYPAAGEEGSETFMIYPLSQTVSGADGEGNDNDNPDGGTTASTQLYIRVLGWDINATAKESYMSKNMDINWNLGWNWDAGTDFRSYWATSWVYGLDEAAIESKLDYANTDQLTKEIAAYGQTKDIDVAYCNENTNDPANFVTPNTVAGTTTYSVNSRVATNVVLKTQVVDATGKPIDMISARGILFREDAYIRYTINRAFIGETTGGTTTALNIYTASQSDPVEGEGGTTTTTVYNQIGVDYFAAEYPEDANGRVGAVNVVLVESQFDTANPGKYYYKDANAAGTTDDPTYKPYTAEGLTTAIAEAKTAIENAQEGANAVIFDKGFNVYYIPIEHLGAQAEGGVAKDKEGYYGVVRNHWYKLSINSFSKVGHGIWDPSRDDITETLKPDKPEDPLYYLGATINILSWKVVNQGVDL